MTKPPVPCSDEDHPPSPPDLQKQGAHRVDSKGNQKEAKRPLIEDEDDFEAIINFPDGDFVRATSQSKETASTVDTVNSSWDSASWRRDLPAGTIIQPDRRLHERHAALQPWDVELAPKTFSGIVRNRRRAD
eukprot:s1111_g3.t1